MSMSAPPQDVRGQPLSDEPVRTESVSTDAGSIKAGEVQSPAGIDPVVADPVSAVPSQRVMQILAIGFAELVAIYVVWRAIGWHLPVLLGVHLLALAALALQLRHCLRRGDDTSLPLLALLGSFAVGPAGAIGAGCVELLVRSGARDGHLLEDWYERISLSTTIDRVTRHCDNVSIGRTIDLRAGAPASFLARIESGTLAERQAILGLVARRFHVAYLPVLQAALRSPEPMIRVQAAAVASHVRPMVDQLFKGAIADLSVAATHPEGALRLLERLEALTASGLLDESDRLRGLEIQARLGDVVLSGVSLPRLANRAATLANDPSANATFERLLIARRRFADLRSHRSSRMALRNRPHARIRRLGLVPAVRGSLSGKLDGRASLETSG